MLGRRHVLEADLKHADAPTDAPAMKRCPAIDDNRATLRLSACRHTSALVRPGVDLSDYWLF
jgi:hypothetical protein